jgi:hypothetical protein
MVFIRVADVFAIVIVLVVVELIRRFGSPQQLPVTVEWIDELSIDRYGPMVDLLNQGDVLFLRTQPGFTPQMATKFRLQRCQLFREYLGHLDDDFRRICLALKVLIVQSKQDRPDLASVLLWNQIRFAYGMGVVQARLLCYRYGFGSVDVTGLVKLFDGMRLELRALVPADLGAGA